MRVCAQCQVSFCSLYALRPPRELALSVAFFCRGCFDRGLVKPVFQASTPALAQSGGLVCHAARRRRQRRRRAPRKLHWSLVLRCHFRQLVLRVVERADRALLRDTDGLASGLYCGLPGSAGFRTYSLGFWFRGRTYSVGSWLSVHGFRRFRMTQSFM